MLKKFLVGLCGVFSLIYVVAGLALTIQICLRGATGIHWSLFTDDVLNAGREGGLAPILISTFLIVSIACLVTFLISVPVVIYLSDVRHLNSLPSRVALVSLDVLAAVPSIVFGLIGNVLFVKRMDMGYSILAGALTLSLMGLPFFIVLSLQGLKSLPRHLWYSSQALNLSSFRFFKDVIFKSSLPLLASAITITLGRCLAETAALMFTSGYSSRFPHSIFDSGRTLSIHILNLSMNVSGGDKMAYTSAFLLLIGSLFMNSLSKGVFKWWNQRKSW